MDPRDHLRALPDGLACTVCDESVPGDRIRLLARRENLTFIQVACVRCGSTTLEFLADTPPAAVAIPDPPAITADDVLDVHEYLASWQGDLGTLFAPGGAPPSMDGGRRG
ncbi:MAG: hypothetical protein V4515_10730 [Chloroflexota bacterium]